MPSDERVRRLVDRLSPEGSFEVWRAPGRVNLIGEHVDYLGGRVLPFACDLDLLLAVEPRAEGILLESPEEPGPVEVALDGAGPSEGWGRYVAGVVRTLASEGFPIRGVRGVIDSVIPSGAGLSSSAAVEAAVALAVTGGRTPPAELLQRAEFESTGVPCGLMDQVAVLHGRLGHAVLLDAGSGSWEHVPIPGDLGFVVVDTGTRRELSDGRYADRRREAEAALGVARDRLGIGSIRDLGPGDVEELSGVLGDPGARRLRHVVEEDRRVVEAVAALRAGRHDELGRLVDASHGSLRDDYDVSSAVLDEAVAALRGSDGCFAARLVGAGFAGCVLGIVDAGRADRVAEEAVEALEGARAWVVGPADGAGELYVTR